MEPASNPTTNTPKPQRWNGFVLASLLLCTASFACCWFLPACMICASLSILFAILSKKDGLKFPPFALPCVVVSVASLLLSCLLTGYSVYTVFSDEETKAEFYQLYEQTSGVDLSAVEDQLREMYPGLFSQE